MGNGYGVYSNQLPYPYRRLRCLVLSAVGAASGDPPPPLLHMTTLTTACSRVLSWTYCAIGVWNITYGPRQDKDIILLNSETIQ